MNKNDFSDKVEKAKELLREKKSSISEEELYTTAQFFLYDLKFIKGVNCNNPLVILASCFYIATVRTGYRRTQKEVADLFGISESSLNRNYRIIGKKLLDHDCINKSDIFLY